MFDIPTELKLDPDSISREVERGKQKDKRLFLIALSIAATLVLIILGA